MDVEGFKLGRTPAVTASIAGLVEDLWLLTRRGFVTTIDVRMLVRGIPRLSTAETLVVSILSEVCQPASRAEIDGPEALRRRALTAARAQLVAHADAHGGLAPLTDELHAEGVDDLDQLIGGEAAELIAPTSIAPGLDDEHAAARAETAAFVEGLVDADQAVAEHRLAGGQSAREVAKRLDCGVVAVQARERRLRRRLRSRLRKAGETTSDLGDAALDALWSNQPGQLTPPPLTVERVTRSVATRMHPEEPAPFAQRAAWAAGATAIALGAWLLMFTGVLPYYGDDTHPEPQLIVRCNPDCTKRAQLSVLAPRTARHVGVVMLTAGGSVQPVLTDESGRSLTLPFGARQTLVEVPYPAALPAPAADGAIVAIFSSEELSRRDLEGIGSGQITPPPNVLVARATVDEGAAPR